MMFRTFIFLIGFGLAILGGVTSIAYLNMLTIGHGFSEYLHFVSTRVECYLLLIGVLLICFSIYFPRKQE